MANASLAEAEAHLMCATVFRTRTPKLRNVYTGGAVGAQGSRAFVQSYGLFARYGLGAWADDVGRGLGLG
jgi:hypothetical protein